MLSSHPHEAMLPYVPRPPPSLLVDRRAYKTGAEVAPNCPRCDSPNTKFCYYNNYSLTQPRYFCKGCRRYWTKGGSLRNVPVGGGCRKNRRGKSSSSSMRSSSAPDSSLSGRDAGPFGNHRFGSATGSLRPDMVLEGMVGNNPADPGHDMHTAADASTIDLAMLYSKFLNNQQPGNNNGSLGAVTPESAGHVDDGFDTFSASSDVLSPGVLAAPGGHQFDMSPQDGFGEWSGPLSSAGAADPASATSTTSTMLCTDASVQAALGELNFVMDQSCFDGLGLPMPAEDGAASSVGNDLSSWCSIVPSLSTWEEPKYDSLDSFPDDALSLHDGMLAADHDWSADCQGLEALYMP